MRAHVCGPTQAAGSELRQGGRNTGGKPIAMLCYVMLATNVVATNMITTDL